MKTSEIAKFTVNVYKFVSPLILEAMKKSEIKEYYFQQSRSIVSVEKKNFLFSSKISSMENIMDTYHFYTTPEKEYEIYNSMVQIAGLNQEGRGSIFSEPALLVEKSESEVVSSDINFNRDFNEKLMGIYCIIQRGRGNIVAKTALDNGSSVPAVFYGIGGGIRDRMGLIRITIPAEKEMVNIIVAEHDCLGMMNVLIDAANLDRPGMGFIFCYPVNFAAIDTKGFIGSHRAAASISQIVNALDEVIGNTDWRKRVINPFKHKERTYLENLENLMLICNDTKAREMLDVAMSYGATGATISKCRKIAFNNLNVQTKTAFEISDMVVGVSQKKGILDSLINAGFLDNEINGKIIIKKCRKAFSYSDHK